MHCVALVLYQPPPTRELETRMTLLAELHLQASELARMLDEERAKIREFEKRWRPAVGKRYIELEDVKQQSAELRRLAKLARAGKLTPTPGQGESEEAPHQAFRPDEEARKLFRQLARKIHPDFADDFEDRRVRHELMAEATRAYRNRDHRRLLWLLEHWDANPILAKGRDIDSRIARTNQQIAWERYRIQDLHHEIAGLGASSSAEIMREAKEATKQGRNFVAEMRNRVLSDLVEARSHLRKVDEAIREEFDAKTVLEIRRRAGLA
ncbi:MAG: hypothetical protein H6509_02545 [Bryobacterales bacterium]|nr:hypothetical protein [Bryobacterales bacterium]